MRDTDCRRAREIRAAQTAGEQVGGGDLVFLTRHTESCPACSREQRAVDAFVEELSGGAPRLDDIARRRWVDSTLELSGRQLEQPERPSLRAARRRNAWLAAASSLAAVVALVLVGAWLWPGGEPVREGSRPAARHDIDGALTGRGTVLLSAGDVRLGGAPTGVGMDVLSGARLTTGSGRAVLSLPGAAVVELAPGTDLEVERVDQGSVSVYLSQGEVLCQVDPEASGPPLAVATRSGRVTVTGTAFAVAALRDEVQLEVYRGSVRVEEANGELRRVQIGQKTVLGSAETLPLTRDEVDAARLMLGAFDLLEGQQPAVVDLLSLPSGARVTVDGKLVGTTPLAAAVRAGHRRLELSLEGHESVRELVELVPGEELSRTFDLRQAQEADAGGQVGVAATGSAGGGATRRPGGQAGARRAPEPVEAILDRAHSLRADRDWPAAARAYEQLIMQHPGSPQARASLVSLGRIQLNHLGRPAGALNSFDAYLAVTRRGTLAQEAAFGRATALRAMGRSLEEERALRGFLAEFPGAIQTERARERLAQIDGAKGGFHAR